MQPTGESVAGGQAISSQPNAQTTLIQQSTDKAIINWSSFSVSNGSSVVFQQPSSSSVTLNRVGLSGGPSNIDGSLQANGQVWIVNPSGVFFGRGAQVNVGGLIATTADIRDQDFNAGNYAFTHNPEIPGAGIVNMGKIVAAQGGSVVLAGTKVKNKGLIQAGLGTVQLAAGKSFAVDFQGDKLVRFAVTAAIDHTPVDKNGNPVDALVSNTGTISANGGRVVMTARAAKNVVDKVINTTGIVGATSVKKINGEIVLDAGDDGIVQVAGSLDASCKGAGETGGSVTVTGGSVKLASTARADVSGDAGGEGVDRRRGARRRVGAAREEDGRGRWLVDQRGCHQQG